MSSILASGISIYITNNYILKLVRTLTAYCLLFYIYFKNKKPLFAWLRDFWEITVSNKSPRFI